MAEKETRGAERPEGPGDSPQGRPGGLEQGPEGGRGQDLALIPETVGGLPVPRTLEQLAKLLEWSKDRSDPVPIRASHLPEPMRQALYKWQGVPDLVNPGEVLIFAGNAYVTSDGAVAAALSHPNVVFIGAEHVSTMPCKDPSSGCPYPWKAKQNDHVFIYRGKAIVDNGSGKEKELVAEHRACPHLTYARPIFKVAQTRALRTVSAAVLGLSASAIADYGSRAEELLGEHGPELEGSDDQ